MEKKLFASLVKNSNLKSNLMTCTRVGQGTGRWKKILYILYILNQKDSLVERASLTEKMCVARMIR